MLKIKISQNSGWMTNLRNPLPNLPSQSLSPPVTAGKSLGDKHTEKRSVPKQSGMGGGIKIRMMTWQVKLTPGREKNLKSKSSWQTTSNSSSQTATPWVHCGVGDGLPFLFPRETLSVDHSVYCSYQVLTGHALMPILCLLDLGTQACFP